MLLAPGPSRVVIGRDWVSGVYLGKLTAAKHRYQSYVIFIVKDDVIEG